MSYIKSFVFIIIFLFMVIRNGTGDENGLKFGRGQVELPNQKLIINVDVADTERQRMVGLMFRKKLSENNGMIFVFEQENRHRVWMKDTLIPLDVIFISAQHKIVSIIKALSPCNKKSCPIFVSTEIAKYMLEVNAGMVQKNGIKTGQKVILKL